MFFELSLIFYILSFALLLLYFFYNKSVLQIAQPLFLLLAILLNGAEIFISWRMQKSFAQYTLHDFLMLITLSLSAVYMIFIVKSRKPFVGFFIMPVVLATGFAGLFMGDTPVNSRAMESVWLYLHIPLTVMGTAFFVVAFGAAVMHFILENQLKQKKFGRIFDRFPSLNSIDSIHTTSLYLGFTAYTAGILSAIGWVRFRLGDDAVPFGNGFLLKVHFAMATWLAFLVILVLKYKYGMNTQQTALATKVGFVCVIATYVGVAYFIMR